MNTALLTPAQRLTLSRERLRLAMARPDGQNARGTTASHKSSGLGLLDVLKLAVPSVGLVIDALGQWWASQPLQASGNIAEGLVDQILRPLAKRHPIALVAGAAGLGALLIWIRPWRWAWRPPVLSSLGPVLFSSVLASGAVQSWLQSLMAKASAPVPSPHTGPIQTPPNTPTPPTTEDHTG